MQRGKEYHLQVKFCAFLYTTKGNYFVPDCPPPLLLSTKRVVPVTT